MIHGAESSEGEGRGAIFADAAFLLLAVAVVALPPWLRSLSSGPVEVRDGAPATLRIDANRAAWYEWMLLEGIGETRARRIVEYRRAHGPFRSLEDLLAIPRMPPGWTEKAREHLTFGEEPPAGRPSQP